MSSADEFEQQVMLLYKEKDWRGILALNTDSNNINAIRFLWVWPSENNLRFIAEIVQVFQCKGIASIGCGCGLLEWILRESTGLDIIGYEVNEEWWNSKYSCPKFIPLKYCDGEKLEEIEDENWVLLFCYFNSHKAFLSYVENYKGDVIIIIGPGQGKGHHTDPEPFKPNFSDNNWKLYKFQEVKQSKDFIAVYIRISRFIE